MPQEHERNAGTVNCPFHTYLQRMTSTNTLKLTLPHKVELQVPVCLQGTPKQFLVHIQQALDAIRQKGLQLALDKAIKDKEEWTKKLNKATEAFENYKGWDYHPTQKKVVEKATEAAAREQETIESLITQVFQRYSSLLSEGARRPWCKILGEQIDVTPWGNLF